MKEQVTVGITKETHEQLQHVDFSDVVVKLKSLKCELNLDDKTEKDHCAILDIEIPQKENQMNIDKVETQTEHQEEMSAFSGEVDWKSGDECVVINDNDRYRVYDDHKKHLGSVGIIRSLFKTKNGTEMAAVQAENGDCICWRVVMLSKPETPQQREDRERLDCIKKMHRDGNVDGAESDLLFFSIEGILTNLYDAGYRKWVK